AANTAACDDGNACTAGDVCAAKACVSGSAISCDDGNVCSDDSCDPASGCVNAANTAACDDGNACTAGDVCAATACVPGNAISCDDGNVCSDDSCDPASGCVNAANTAACDDGNACTAGDVCAAKACVPGSAISCDDGNVCSDDSCDPATGCVHTDNTAGCDDGDACTEVDVCQGGACQPGGGCAAEASCLAGPRRCECDSGYAGDGFSCADVDECITNNGGCDGNATCVNTIGSRTCACDSGYTGNGVTCTDVDECLVNNGGCHPLTTCTNSAGSFTCGACPSGYTGSGVSGCVDVDECLDSPSCVSGTECVNTPGSYACDVNIPGLALWVSADVGVTLVNDAVSKWADQSGNGNHFLQSDPTRRPTLTQSGIGGHPSITTNGALGQTLITTTNFQEPVTVFVVARQTGSYRGRLLAGYASNWLLGWYNGSAGCAFFDGWVIGCLGPELRTRLYTAVQTGSLSTVYRDGVQIASNSGGLVGPNGLVIGGMHNSEYSDADIAEVRVYSGALSNVQRQAVEARLNTKYGIYADCAIANGGCGDAADCANNAGVISCTCKAGYTGDPRACSTVLPTPTALWLDATDADTVIRDQAGLVSLWADKTSLHRDATALTSAEPVWNATATPNLKPAILFDGSAVRLETPAIPSAPQMTIFVAYRIDAPDATGVLMSQGDGAYFSLHHAASQGDGDLVWQTNIDDPAPSLAIDVGQWKVLTVQQTATTSEMYFWANAKQVVTHAPIASGTSSWVIGNGPTDGRSIGGYIAEIRAYSSTLTATERAAIEADLRWKYDIAITGGVGSYENPGTSCLQIQTSMVAQGLTPVSGSGYYITAPLGQVIEVTCDMTTEGGGYTYFPVASGKSSSRYTDDDTCKDYGLAMAVPRSQAHWTSMVGFFGTTYFNVAPGIYGTAAGNYTNCAMRDPTYYGAGSCSNWNAVDGGRWWLRDTNYGEPNGDYTPGCWLALGMWGTVNPASLAFNDGGCGYSTTKYICSTNDKQ
ncbi:MAG: hypothetical protein IV100_12345, partial [Myxococcales bacterium]|nr:hypothetical protein [Myxococcales bacterium]